MRHLSLKVMKLITSLPNTVLNRSNLHRFNTKYVCNMSICFKKIIDQQWQYIKSFCTSFENGIFLEKFSSSFVKCKSKVYVIIYVPYTLV